MNINEFILTLALTCTLLLSSCGEPSPAGNYGAVAVPVNIYQVQQEKASYVDVYPATLVAQNQVEIRSEVNGFITGVFFEEGTSVAKGQKLYEIERAKFAAAYTQAQASVQIAQANVEKAQKDAERYTRLNEANAVTKQRYEYALTDLENAKGQLVLASAQLSSAGADLRHSVIIAPFDGTIGVSQAKKGSFISAGQTALNTISSDNPIAVDLMVDEKQIREFTALNQNPAAASDSIFTILLPDKSIYPYPGKISFIDRAVDPQTGTIRVRFSFPNRAHTLKPGMSCNLRVRSNAGKDELLAPFKAVTEQMGEYFVYIAEGDTARQRRVDLGARLGEKVIVLTGLEAGEKIVVEGIQKLREGTAIKISNASAPRTGQATPGQAAVK